MQQPTPTRYYRQVCKDAYNEELLILNLHFILLDWAVVTVTCGGGGELDILSILYSLIFKINKWVCLMIFNS